MITEEAKVGCFQIILLFLLAVNYAIVAMSHALPVFHNYTPRFYCETSDGTNRTYGCTSPRIFENSTVNDRGTNDNDVASCRNEYTFVTENGERSVVTDWGLICEKSNLIYLGPMIYYVGVSIGAFVAGILADRIGRLPVLAICLYTQGTMAVATYIVQSYPAFLVLRGLQGAFAQGLQISTYILVLELVPKKLRTLVATIMETAWALGLVLLAVLSYFIPDWRILQLAVSVPTAVTVLYIWIVPESPRWLLAKGKSTEADIVLENIVKYNTCCCNRSQQVAKTDNSVNTIPERPERKSRLLAVINETTESAKGDASESTNLLTPTVNPAQRKSRATSLKATTEKLEKRLSNLETLDPEVHITENNSTTDKSIASSNSTKSNRNSRLSSNFEAKQDVGRAENEEASMITTSSPETITEEPNGKNNEIRVIEELQEAKTNLACTTRRNRYLTKYLIVMAYEWFTASLTQNVVHGVSPDLSSDRHVGFAIGGGLEIIVYVLTYFALSQYGRRLPMSVCQFLNGIICITVGILAVLPHFTITWIVPVRTASLLIGRATAASSLATVYLCTVEIFPTVIRGACLGLCVLFGKIGSLSAPHILSLKNHTTIAAPLTLVGFLCMLSGLMYFLLPETAEEALSDTVQQMGRIASKNKIGVEYRDYKKNASDEKPSEQEILREKLFSEEWVDAGNGIIVNFSDNKN